jgi:late competence protein required for DNA uptake (superfamily II DNA/RNA helicase)
MKNPKKIVSDMISKNVDIFRGRCPACGKRHYNSGAFGKSNSWIYCSYCLASGRGRRFMKQEIKDNPWGNKK